MTRLWSIHPGLLDRQGLGGCWREALGAQKAIIANVQGAKCGYQYHSALIRFMATPDPVAAIGRFLLTIQEEATLRGYRYDASKIIRPNHDSVIMVTEGQVEYEYLFLLDKLKRSPDWYDQAVEIGPMINNMFVVVPGPIENWEKVKEV